MSMGIIESGEYNKVAGLGGESIGTIVARTFPEFTSTAGATDEVVGSLPLTKGKWVVQGQIRPIGSVSYARSISITRGAAIFDARAYAYVPEVGGCGVNVVAVLKLTENQNVNLTCFASGNVATWQQAYMSAVKVSD